MAYVQAISTHEAQVDEVTFTHGKLHVSLREAANNTVSVIVSTGENGVVLSVLATDTAFHAWQAEGYSVTVEPMEDGIPF